MQKSFFKIHLYIHCVANSVYHLNFYDNFNYGCLISVREILLEILLSEYAIEKGFNFLPHLFIILVFVPYLGETLNY